MTDTAAVQRKLSALANWRQYIIYLGFVVIFLVFAVTLYDKGFLDPNNLLNIVRQTAMIAIMAVAMTFVLSAGEIDLSIGAVAGLASVADGDGDGPFGVAGGILGGLRHRRRCRAVNGLLTTRIGIPSFLTTLAMMGIARGVAMWISGTAAIPILEQGLHFDLRRRQSRPGPGLLIWMADLRHRRAHRAAPHHFGRRVLATGGNETAARYSGVDTRAIKLRVLMISTVAAAVAGMLYAGRLQSGRFQLGEGDELSVIAAAVLGGTSLFGGAGTVVGSIVGALMIGLINNGLMLMGLEFSQQLIARGAIIIIAVAISQPRKRK